MSHAVIVFDHMGRPISVTRRKEKAAAFDGAGHQPRTKSWDAPLSDVNSIIWTDIELLRSRVRDTIRKNPYAENALSGFTAAAVGTGAKPQSQHKNKGVRKAIQEAFNRWTDEADVTGQQDFYGLQKLAVRAMREGGDCFGRMLAMPLDRSLSVPFQVQLIEAEQVPTAENLRRKTPPPAATGNTVEMGVETDSYGKPVAYHVHKFHPGSRHYFSSNGETTRVPATEMFHFMEPLRPGQRRGLPWFTPAVVDLWDLRQYTEAQMQKQKVAAMFLGFLRRAAPGAGAPLQDLAEPTVEVTVDDLNLKPGSFSTIDPGQEIEWSDPPDAGSFVDFVRIQLRAIAAGLGITYEMISGDLERINYSSIRAGLLEFRRRVEMFQHQLLIYQVCRPVFNRWLMFAVMSGALKLPGYWENPREYEMVRWITQGFPWVDPLKDVKAKIMEVRAGFDSRQGVISSKGEDRDQIDAENADDQKSADALGLTYDSDARVEEEEGSTAQADAMIAKQDELEELQRQRTIQ